MNVFIIGSGFTKAVFLDAPLNRELLHVLASQSTCSGAATLLERYKTDDIEIALTSLDSDIAVAQGKPGSGADDSLLFIVSYRGNILDSIWSVCSSN